MTDSGQMGMDNQWRNPQYRQKVVAQIEEAMRQSGNPITKSSIEMEQHVFQKARSREEYLALVARLIIHVREIKTKGQGDGKFGPGGQPMQTGVPIQSPIDALRFLTSVGPGTNAPQQPGMTGQMMAGPMQPGPQQPFQTYQQRGAMPTHQGQMPNQMPVRMPSGTMPGMRPEFNMHQGPAGIQQPPPQFTGGMNQPSQQIPSGPFMTNDSMPSQTQHIQSMPQTTFGNIGLSVVTTSASNISQQRPPVPPQMTSQPVSQPTNTISGPEPSPITSLGIAHSPITILPVASPSSVQTQVAQSPASRSFGGAPSPGTGLTAPSSLGPAPSPASSANEEQAYLAKWKQLQIYKEPLKRMINRMAKDEDRKNMNKMKNLLDILSDSSKRVSMNALLKCEQVLRQMDPKPYSLPPKAEDTHMCQTLLDAVVSQIKSPMLNHTLQRTFGPAVQALHGPPIRVPSPPPKRIKSDEDTKDNVEIPNLLQGEVARLDDRFLITLHQQHHVGSKTIQLLCHLKDKNLPSVPAIPVSVPEDYPHTSPICDAEMEEYNTTPFLQKVQKLLAGQLLQLPDKYALTALVGAWEMSVRKACNPAVL